jgi:uncharacterized protein
MKINTATTRNIFINAISHILAFSILSFAFTLVLLLFYYMGTGYPGNIVTWIYVATIPCYYYLIITICLYLLVPLYFVPYARFFVIAPKVIIDTYLLINLFIFNIYQSHVDLIFMNILIHDYHGIGIPTYIVMLAIAACAVIILMNAIVFRKALRFKRWPARVAFTALILFIIGRVLLAWGNEYNQNYLTRYNPCFPLYMNSKASDFIKRMAKHFPVIIPESSGRSVAALDLNTDNTGSLTYPLKKMECSFSPEKKYNILFFLLESWRSDCMNEKITPVISGFAKKSYVFSNHLSGGNVTPYGLFSLMYGLHPTYMKYITSDPMKYPPVFMNVLKENGYDVSVYTSSNLDGFSMKEMFFHGIAASKYTVREEHNSIEDDNNLVSEFIDSLKAQKPDSPFFKFVFVTSSHYSYSYTDKHSIFEPTARGGSFLFNKYEDPTPLMNKYKNSLHNMDALFGEVLKALKDASLDSKTIIILTSDHGEEFNDKGYGYWGHGSNFTGYQTSVPLIMYLPGDAKGQVVRKRSSHIDVVPTLLRHAFGCVNNISDYSSGEDLMNLPGHRSLIAMSYKNKAYIIDDTVYSEGITLNSFELYDIKKRNNDFNYREIALLKESENAFSSKRKASYSHKLTRTTPDPKDSESIIH